VPEQVAHGRTGQLAGDADEGELGARLAEILSHPAAARRMGEAGRAFVLQRRTIDSAVDAYRNAYVDAIRAWRLRQGRGPRHRRGRLARWVAKTMGWEARPANGAFP
jgi:hypothetical protein